MKIDPHQSTLNLVRFRCDLDLVDLDGAVWFGSDVYVFCTRFDGYDIVQEHVVINRGVLAAEGCVISPGAVLRSMSTWDR